jgi:peptidoglycan/LPS O-acetylase OafA/YrhL
MAFYVALVVPGFLVGRCLLLQGDSMMNPRNVAVDSAVCLLLGLSIPLFKAVPFPWVTGSSHQIAKYSYGIYLFHIPALIFILKYFAPFSFVFKLVAYVVLSGAVSVFSYHVVEHPLIQFGKRVAERFESQPPLQGQLEVEGDSSSGVPQVSAAAAEGLGKHAPTPDH